MKVLLKPWTLMTIDTATMSERGQIVIPKEIRKYVGAVENTLFTLMPLDKDTIIMKKIDKEKLMGDLSGLQQQLKEMVGHKKERV